jgi:hypothetical protein
MTSGRVLVLLAALACATAQAQDAAKKAVDGAVITNGPDAEQAANSTDGNAENAADAMENLACMNDCSGNGDCIKGHCECRTGWTFTDCSIKQCPNDCAGPDGKVRGKCESGKCICNAGWTGLDCGSAACPNDCSATANVTALLKNAPAWSDTAVLTALRALARMIAVAMASA